MQCPFYTKQKPKYTIRCQKKVTGQSGGHLGCSTHCSNGGVYHYVWMGDLNTYPKEKQEVKKMWKKLFVKSKNDYFKEAESKQKKWWEKYKKKANNNKQKNQ